jgi:putative addiction module component (TIGR02574 family)
MPHSLPLPPPGFDALSIEDQIDYVQSLWDRIAATAGQVPLQDWQQALLEERLVEHRRTPDDARPWEEVIERVQQRLSGR